MKKDDLSLSYSARKALTVHLGESAGNEIASLLQRMAAQIEECLQNPALIATLGSAAQKSVKDRAWRDVSEEVVTFIEKIASSR